MQKNLLTRFKIAAFTLTMLPITSALAIDYQGPLVVDDAYVATHGTVITGNFQGTTSAPAITVSTATPVTITGSNLTGPGDLIFTTNGSLTVTNNTGIETNPNVNGMQKGMFVHVEGAVSVVVQNNTITGPKYGVYINGYSGSLTSTPTITISNNVMNNIDGRPSDGNGGYVTSGEFNGHAIQLNQVQSVPNIQIAWNQVINTPSQSQCSDIINIYQSSGTSASPLIIHDNFLQGAFPTDPGVDSYTGGGIITDGTANDTAATASAFVNIYNNQVVASANYGYSIAAGHDNNIYNNRVISSGVTSSGAFYPTTFGNGLENYNNYNQPATTMFNDLVDNNVSGYIRKSSSGTAERADWYLPNQTTGTNTSFVSNDSTDPTLSDESNEFSSWSAKLTANQITIGSNNKTARGK